MQERVLVTGAAGYIGSAVCWELIEAGYEVVALDSLLYGVLDAVPPAAHFVRLDLAEDDLTPAFAQPIYAVCHLAAESAIPLSMTAPERFWQTNVYGGLRLLRAMRDTGCRRIVYSSTSSVYEPRGGLLHEASPLGPVSAYGESKLAFERLLHWFSLAHGTAGVTFRYFNVAGATEHVWERPYHRTRIIPVALDVARGRLDLMPLNGTDYPTHDGTCVRDYLHVADVATAHRQAIECLDGLTSVGNMLLRTINLGIGTGYSNREVIHACERISGRRIQTMPMPRRPGDPPSLIANGSLALRLLDWQPQFRTLDAVIESAWRHEPNDSRA